jgi:hypothetical protein
MYSDPGWGFHVWRCMQQGGPWNYGCHPDSSNIARDSGGYCAAWTPGQYLFPGLLTYCGLSLGKAISVTIALFSVLGVTGWFLVYKAFNFSDELAWFACATIVSLRSFAAFFGIYDGGEILLFGGAPFVLLFAMRTQQLGLLEAILMALVFLASFFLLKNGALILALAICATMPFASAAKHNWRALLLGWFKWGLVFLVTYLAANRLHNSRGWTAMSYTPQIRDKALSLSLFDASGPLLSLSSLGDLLNRLLSNPDKPLLTDWDETILVTLPLGAASLLAYSWVLRSYAGTRYGRFCLGVLLAYLLVFGALYISGAAIEPRGARYYRPAGFLLLPGLLALGIGHTWRVIRVATVVWVLFVGLYGFASYANKIRYLQQRDTVGTEGFTQLIVDHEALNWLIQKDQGLHGSSQNNLFYLPSPEISLEVHNARVLLDHADFVSIDVLATTEYFGTVDNLFVVLPDKFLTNGKAEVILSSFKDYPDRSWKSQQVGQFVVYYPSAQVVQP